MGEIENKDARAKDDADERESEAPARKPLRIVIPGMKPADEAEEARETDGTEPAENVEPVETETSTDIGESPSLADENVANGDETEEPGSPQDPLAAWVASVPQYRRREADALLAECPEFPVTVTPEGRLQKPVRVDDWVFLLEYGTRFPNAADDGDVPIRAYLAVPSADEIVSGTPLSQVPGTDADASGQTYVSLSGAEPRYDAYLHAEEPDATALAIVLDELSRWRSFVIEAIAEASALAADDAREKAGTFAERRKLFPGVTLPIPALSGMLKYVDGRVSEGELPNPRCRKVVLSDRALVQICNETRARYSTETGGLLLGHYVDDVWYVVESSDPGNNGVFEVAYHESDPDYANHVCTILSRSYKYPLVFLGMWHRHPGSLDSFSGTDDATNLKYADSCGNGCISALVNYDPDFRLTFYYAEREEDGNVLYTKVDVECGDDRFEDPDILRLATLDEIAARVSIDDEAPMPEYATIGAAEADGTYGGDDGVFGMLRRAFGQKSKTRSSIGESESLEVASPRCKDADAAADEEAGTDDER